MNKNLASAGRSSGSQLRRMLPWILVTCSTSLSSANAHAQEQIRLLCQLSHTATVEWDHSGTQVCRGYFRGPDDNVFILEPQAKLWRMDGGSKSYPLAITEAYYHLNRVDPKSEGNGNADAASINRHTGQYNSHSRKDSDLCGRSIVVTGQCAPVGVPSF